MSSEMKMTFSPYIPNDQIPEKAVFVAQEGKFTPLDNGEWSVHPFAYDRWEKEEMSWYETSYIHAGLNPFLFFDIKGKEYLDLMEAVSVNTFRNFPIGKARHTILCNEQGKIILDGIIMRRSEDEFVSGCLPDPVVLNQMCGNKFHITSEATRCKRFFYQLCGPKSLQIVEDASRSDLHDLKFMYLKDAVIDGRDVFILRTGMAGTLGYEVHGRLEDAHAVYKKLLEVGEKYGIQPLGRYGYVNAHCDGSIPQVAEHFATPFDDMPVISGSISIDSELLYRSPIDLGWEKLVRFNHEFVGKEALQKELEGPHNTCVHLIWDKEDILKVIAATMDPEKRVDTLDMVCDYDYVRNNGGLHMDEVYDGDRLIGASSGRMLSPKTRDMISLCTLKEEYAVEGRMVEVLWGNPGTYQMRVRATVTLFPYNKVDRNESFDVERIPHPHFD